MQIIRKKDDRPLKAYLITVKSWRDFSMVFPGQTRGKAVSCAFFSSDIAGFDIPFTDFRARRAPQFDDIVQEANGKFPWCFGWRDGNETWGCLSG